THFPEPCALLHPIAIDLLGRTPWVPSFPSIRARPALRAGADLSLYDLVGPYLETDELVRSERLGNRDVTGVATLGDQDAADSRFVIARIERMPAPADIGL